MTATKFHRQNVFLIVALLGAMAASYAWPCTSQAQVSPTSQPTMRAGYLLIRVAGSAEQRTLSVPEGYLLDHWLLEPTQVRAYRRPSMRTTSTTSRLAALEERLLRTAIVRYAGPISPLQAAAAARKDPRIQHAEPWYEAELHAIPNDPMVGVQQALTTIGMTQAWDVQQGDTSIVIAISDNGVDQGHEDLSGSLWTNHGEIPNNQIDDDGNGYVDDYQGYNFTWREDGTNPGVTINYRGSGHGTRVAGIACAATNNGIGIAGIAWKCKMLPLKTARIDQGGILYGYQSLMYAAQMGARIVNCSWGVVKPASIIDQDVVDYCTEMGTLVVASAGNHGDGVGGLGWQLINFPASYRGVLGVGESTTNDRVVESSGLGINASIMTPGNRAYTTEVGGGYSSQTTTGTSFAAPIAAGVAALVAAQYPNLTPWQIAALIRESADDIDGSNPAYAAALPGRINAYRALTTPPSSTPSLRIVRVERRHLDGRPGDRFAAGDTLELWYVIANDLAASTAGSYQLRVAAANRWTVSVPVDRVEGAAIPAGGRTTIGPFRIVISQQASPPCILELSATADAYRGAMLDYQFPSSTMGTFENNQLLFSMGDDGTFGYNTPLISRVGAGFAWKSHYALISPSGFLFAEGGTRALKAFDNITNQSEFTVEKPFADPDSTRAVFSDAGSGKQIGVRITQRCILPTPESRTAVLDIVLENRGSSPLQDVAAGYYFDWDVATARDNTTRLIPEAVPLSSDIVGVAQAFEHATLPVAVVCAAATSDGAAEGQSAGMLIFSVIDDADGITDQDVVMLLSSGTSMQTQEVGDVSGVIGIKFPGTLAAGATKRMTIVIGVDSTAASAAEAVRETLLNPSSVATENDLACSVYPNPTSSQITILHPPTTKSLTIFDALGSPVLVHVVDDGVDRTDLALDGLAQGRYLVQIAWSGGRRTIPITVLR